MIIAGGILIAIGFFSTIYGIHQNNSIEAQLTALFTGGNVNPGTGWIWIGVIFLIGGAVLLFLAFKNKPVDFPSKFVIPSIPRKAKHCPHCDKQINISSNFCPYCGKEISPRTDKTPSKPDDNTHDTGHGCRGNHGGGLSTPTDADM